MELPSSLLISYAHIHDQFLNYMSMHGCRNMNNMEFELQKALQQVTIAVKFLEEASKADLDENTLSQIEDSLKSINKLSSSWDSSEDMTCFADHLSDIGIVKVFLEVTHSLLKSGFTAKNWPCLYALRAACLNMSHRFESFCADLGSTGFVVTLVNELKIYDRAYISQNVSIL